MLATARTYWILWLVLIVLAGGSTAFLLGYRLDTAGFSRVGTLSMSNLPRGTTLYVDESRQVFSSVGITSTALSAGSHSVIVDAPGYLPWNERFEITAGENTELTPILVTEEPVGKVLSGEDATRALALIRAANPPVKASPLTLENGCALAYASGGRILADATTTPACATPPYLECVSQDGAAGICATTIVYTAPTPIISMIAYPGRTDAVIIAESTGVYGVELDPREPQYVVPLFTGTTIGAAPWSDSSIVISDGTTVVELSL